METVTAIFDSRQAAEKSFSKLSAGANFNRENLLLLTPDAGPKKIDRVSTDEGEQPGMGSAIGGVVGGAVGLATGAVLSNLMSLSGMVEIPRLEAKRRSVMPAQAGI